MLSLYLLAQKHCSGAEHVVSDLCTQPFEITEFDAFKHCVLNALNSCCKTCLCLAWVRPGAIFSLALQGWVADFEPLCILLKTVESF